MINPMSAQSNVGKRLDEDADDSNNSEIEICKMIAMQIKLPMKWTNDYSTQLGCVGTANKCYAFTKRGASANLLQRSRISSKEASHCRPRVADFVRQLQNAGYKTYTV